MPGRNLCLLSLDGGGDRGLSSLLILKQLMESINPDRPPEPCDHFDMIGGISIGGYVFSTGREMDMLTYSPRLMAIMLGRLRMGINECINTYFSQFDRVFKKKRHRATIMSKVQDRFDMKELERAIKEIVFQQCGQQRGSEDALLQDGNGQNVRCKVYNEILSGRVWLC
jgi:Patatin-like phospholipase